MTRRRVGFVAVAVVLSFGIATLIFGSTIIQLIREARYGEVVIDARTDSLEITESRNLPAGKVLFINHDGTTHMHSQDIPLDVLTNLLEKALPPGDPSHPASPVDDALARLKSAKVAFNAPEHAQVNRPL